MEPLFGEFIEFWWVNIATIIITIIGVLLSVPINHFFRLRRQARPSYVVESSLALTTEGGVVPSEVSLYFGKIHIQKLTKEIVRFWNHGGETLYGKAITKRKPIRIVFGDDIRILKHKTVKKTEDANEFKLAQLSQNTASISFDYLNVKDGVVLELWHDGNVGDFIVKGTIKGIKGGIVNLSRPDTSNMIERSKRWLLIVLMVTFGVFYLVEFYDFIFDKIPKLGLEKEELPFLKYLILQFGLLVIEMGGVVVLGIFFWQKRRRYPKSLVMAERL